MLCITDLYFPQSCSQYHMKVMAGVYVPLKRQDASSADVSALHELIESFMVCFHQITNLLASLLLFSVDPYKFGHRFEDWLANDWCTTLRPNAQCLLWICGVVFHQGAVCLGLVYR